MKCDFNWSRFVAVLRWEMQSHKRFFVRKFAGVFFALMLLLYLIHFNNSGLVWLLGLFLFTFSVLGIGQLFYHLKTKQDYVSYLMLPASHLEKFVARWLMFTVVWTLIGLLGMIAAFLVTSLLGYIFGGWTSDIPTLLDLMRSWAVWDYSLSETLSLVIVVAWIHSIYLLGGTFFRRNAPLLTTVVVFAVGVLVAVILTKCLMRIDWDVYEVNETVAYWYGTIGGSLWTILNYCLSFRIFKRFQIIAYKWINV